MPVANAKKPYRIFQVGEESVFGTEVAATRRIRTIDFDWGDPGSWRKYTPNYTIGRMSLRPDVGEIVRKGFMAKASTDLTFEDILLAFHMGLGNPTPIEQTAGQGDFLYTFVSAPTAGDPAPKSYTLEGRFGDGTSSFDRTVTAVMCPGFEISFPDDGDAAKLSYDMWGRTPNNNALTTGLVLPTPFDLIAALDIKLYIDNAATFAYSPTATLNGALTSSATSVPYTSTGDPIAVNDIIQVDNEKMRVTAVDTGTNTLTVVRGVNGTTAVSHLTGVNILRPHGEAPSSALTAVASTLRSCTIRGITGIEPWLAPGDGRLDASDYDFGPRGVEVELETAVNNSMLNSATGERAKYENGDKRYVRLEATGSQIGTGLNKRFRMSAALDYVDNGFGHLGRDTNGKEVVTLSFQSIADSDFYDVVWQVLNSLSAWPG